MTELSKDTLARLSATARRAATDAEWFDVPTLLSDLLCEEAEADLIAACSPDVILALVEQHKKMADFARFVLENCFEGCDTDGGDAQDTAHDLGLLVKTTYDPEKHGEADFAEPGDDWYVFADWVKP